MEKPTKATVISAARATLLIDQLSAAYAEAQQADDPALQKLLLTNAIALNNGTPYLEVVNQLTHAISVYYVHYQQVPPVVLALYRGLQADVTAGAVDAAALRKQNLATGLIFTPIIFGGH
ncbi:bacteriocin immunity protein [Lactobacillus sp. CBA3605]|uniref:bacteriocin immunity protein n=1 Tax=Lactobacillus sp. CBA3605 TaxID=2099788 RepID=UPI001319F7F2|nr:bacteriocin immunity protein [Lactobacillus sp. CBA3605]